MASSQTPQFFQDSGAVIGLIAGKPRSYRIGTVAGVKGYG
ncbi:hypothetical protein C4K35_3455 [Pseudomonas chlororaphis subsp. piscium]|nr:hypothetical protein C4K35_3455 [Pseudomonas chlororaphis subsp. piscium]